MTRKQLFKKYYKDPRHDYEISETLAVKDETGRTPDVCFVYSGRNRGKSYEISTQLLADAWYDKKLFGYVRRNKATTYEIEQYFADKLNFITDMTDGTREGITVSRGKIYLYHTIDDEKTGSRKRVLDEHIGYFFAVSTQGAYKSLQYPEVWNLLYEEVLTSEQYLSAEPEKLMNLWSTVSRSRPGFHMWLVSNTISVVNPYSQAWGIQLAKNKPGEIRLSKLYLGAADADGKEQYMLIAAHYLEDKDDISAEAKKDKRKLRVKTSVASNRWDELKLYTVMDKSFLDPYKPLCSVVFEYDDLMFLCEIIMKPANIYQLYTGDEEKESRLKMPFAYIQRKTTEPQANTRIYTNNSNRMGLYVTKGYRKLGKIDDTIEMIRKNGWFVGSDNLTMNDFMTVFTKLRTI